MERLFGTDGIRGLAGRFPLTAREAFKLGRAAGRVLCEKSTSPKKRIVAVRDTRWSGPFLSAALFKGLREQGIDIYDAGVLCTPAVACLVKAHRFDSGVVVSASHNPPEFNGIKFFTGSGRKWPDTWEEATEQIYFSQRSRFSKKAKLDRSSKKPGVLISAEVLGHDYEAFLLGTVGSSVDFSRLRLAVDCANGANSKLGPRLLKRLGAQAYVMGASPTGHNINVSCGSQHLERLVQLIRKEKCNCGVAFDGDGDRVIFVDEQGGIVDGDFIIALLAKHFKETGQLKNRAVVITVMANLGLRKALSQLGLRAVEVPVGDRHVSAAMDEEGALLGGEQSGHIILGHYLPTGDGLLTALHLLKVIASHKQPLSKMVRWMKKYPQVLLNVPVKERRPLAQLNGVQKRIEGIGKSLGENGRVLVRYSGTEPLLRIMLEGAHKPQLEAYAKEIADSVTQAMA